MTPSPMTWRVLWQRSWPVLRPWRSKAAVTAGGYFTAAALRVATPLAMMLAIDALTGDGVVAFLPAVALWGALLIAEPLVAEWADVLEADVRLGIDEDLHSVVVERLFTVPPAVHQVTPPAETLEKLEQSAEAFSESVSQVAFHLLPTLVFGIVAIGIMATIDWRITLGVLALAPIPVWVQRQAAKESGRRDLLRIEGFARVYARLTTLLERLLTVQSAGEERREARRFLTGIRKLHGLIRLGARRDRRTDLRASAAGVAAALLVIVAAGHQVSLGVLTVGALLALLQYLDEIFGPVQDLSAMGKEIAASKRALRLLWSLADLGDPLADVADPKPLPQGAEPITLDGVTVVGRGSKPILRQVSLELPATGMVAIVGPSGGGKTTLLRVLQRFVHPESGEVRWGEHSTREMSREALRRSWLLVPQDVHLLPGTLAENAVYGLPPVSAAGRDALADALGLTAVVASLPRGWNTPSSDAESTLSGGQRQRLGILRALLSPAPVLVLDEATSGLDPESERVVLGLLADVARHRLVVLVSHRAAAVRAAERVVLVRQGRVVRYGLVAGELADPTSPIAKLFAETKGAKALVETGIDTPPNLVPVG